MFWKSKIIKENSGNIELAASVEWTMFQVKDPWSAVKLGLNRTYCTSMGGIKSQTTIL